MISINLVAYPLAVHRHAFMTQPVFHTARGRLTFPAVVGYLLFNPHSQAFTTIKPFPSL